MTENDTTDRIRAAVVSVVAEEGIGAAAMLPIAKRARVSAGTLYNRFNSKDDMLQKIYLQIKRDYHAALMDIHADDPAEVIRQLWRNFFAFLQARPNEFLFLEYAGAAQVLTEAQRAQIAPLQDDINVLIKNAMDRGVMKSLPQQMAVDLLIGPAMTLARRCALAGREATQTEIDLTFETLWSALRA